MTTLRITADDDREQEAKDPETKSTTKNGFLKFISGLVRGIRCRLRSRESDPDDAEVWPLGFEDKVKFVCWRAVGLLVGARPVAFRNNSTRDNEGLFYVIGIRARTRVRMLGGDFSGFQLDNALNGSLGDFMLFPGDVKIVLVNNTCCWGTECTCEVLHSNSEERRWWNADPRAQDTTEHRRLLFFLRPDCSPCEQDMHSSSCLPRVFYGEDDPPLPGVRITGNSRFFFVCEFRSPEDLCDGLFDVGPQLEDLRRLQNSHDRAKGHLYRAWDIIGSRVAANEADGASGKFTALELAARIEHFFTEFGLLYLAYLQLRERTSNPRNALSAFVLITLAVINTLLNASLANTIEHFTTSNAWYWGFEDDEEATANGAHTERVRMSFKNHVQKLREDQSKAIVLLLPRLTYSLGVLVLQQPLPAGSGPTAKYLTLTTNVTAAGYWFLCLVILTLWSTMLCKPCLPSGGFQRLFRPACLWLGIGALVIYYHLKQDFPFFPGVIPWYVPHIILLFVALFLYVVAFVIKPIFFQVGVMHSTISVLVWTAWRLIRPLAHLLYELLSNPKKVLKEFLDIVLKLLDKAITNYLQLLLIASFALGGAILLCAYMLFWRSAARSPL